MSSQIVNFVLSKMNKKQKHTIRESDYSEMAFPKRCYEEEQKEGRGHTSN